MPSAWKVRKIAGSNKDVYMVYRQCEKNKNRNLQYKPAVFTSRKAAQLVADELNRKENEHDTGFGEQTGI